MSLTYNAALILRDMQLRGWNQSSLARAAQLSKMTVNRFLQGRVQTAKVAKKIADALEQDLQRYVVDAPPQEMEQSQ